MKVVTINGSPKGKESNTNIMIEALTNGMKSPDTSITHIFLADNEIKYCKGCYSCWFKTPGQCIVDDDMKHIINAMENTDVVVLGSPLYFNNISGMLKVFFDRLTAVGGDPREKVSGQISGAAPHFIMMSNCGFPKRSQFEVVSLWINNVAAIVQAKMIGEFYTTHGKVLTQPEPDQQKARAAYLSFLEACGKQFLKNMALQPANRNMLEKNIVDF